MRNKELIICIKNLYVMHHNEKKIFISLCMKNEKKNLKNFMHRIFFYVGPHTPLIYAFMHEINNDFILNFLILIILQTFYGAVMAMVLWNHQPVFEAFEPIGSNALEFFYWLFFDVTNVNVYLHGEI